MESMGHRMVCRWMVTVVGVELFLSLCCVLSCAVGWRFVWTLVALY
jgi:hypothetical protein